MDTLRIYMRDAGRYDGLTAAEERELHRRMRAGDVHARNELVCGMLKLVLKMAQGYARGQADLENLIQEGNAALLKAADRFDPDMGRWSTIAGWWIFQALNRASNSDRLIRVPHHHFEASRAKLLASEEPDVMAPTLSISGLDLADPRTLLDHVADGEELRLSTQRLRAAMGKLDDRRRQVLEMRSRGERLEAIGRALGITRSRVQQLHASGLGKLARSMGVRPQAAAAG